MQLDLINLIERLGLPLVLVWAFIQGWIVPRYVYRQLQESERQFRDLTLQNAQLTDRAVATAERVVHERK